MTQPTIPGTCGAIVEVEVERLPRARSCHESPFILTKPSTFNRPKQSGSAK